MVAARHEFQVQVTSKLPFLDAHKRTRNDKLQASVKSVTDVPASSCSTKPSPRSLKTRIVMPSTSKRIIHISDQLESLALESAIDKIVQEAQTQKASSERERGLPPAKVSLASREEIIAALRGERVQNAQLFGGEGSFRNTYISMQQSYSETPLEELQSSELCLFHWLRFR